MFTKEEIIKLIEQQISNTNLYDKDSYNLGYRQSLRDLKVVINSIKV